MTPVESPKAPLPFRVKSSEQKPPAFKESIKKKEEEPKGPVLPSLFALSFESAAASTDIKEVSLHLYDLAQDLTTHMIELTTSNDIATLTTTYQKEGSPFNNLEIFVDHYSTAPSSFNIELYGQPAAADILTKRCPQLIERLASIMPGHQFNLSPPFIRSESFQDKKRRQLRKSLKI